MGLILAPFNELDDCASGECREQSSGLVSGDGDDLITDNGIPVVYDMTVNPNIYFDDPWGELRYINCIAIIGHNYPHFTSGSDVKVWSYDGANQTGTSTVVVNNVDMMVAKDAGDLDTNEDSLAYYRDSNNLGYLPVTSLFLFSTPVYARSLRVRIQRPGTSPADMLMDNQTIERIFFGEYREFDVNQDAAINIMEHTKQDRLAGAFYANGRAAYRTFDFILPDLSDEDKDWLLTRTERNGKQGGAVVRTDGDTTNKHFREYSTGYVKRTSDNLPLPEYDGATTLGMTYREMSGMFPPD